MLGLLLRQPRLQGRRPTVTVANARGNKWREKSGEALFVPLVYNPRRYERHADGTNEKCESNRVAEER